MTGVTVKSTRAAAYETIEKFYSDEEILEIFPDGEGSLVNALLRRAQAAERQIEAGTHAKD